jgi:pyruvate dehydrogenase E2 component (dihydrolipoamide acetyltransferase)
MPIEFRLPELGEGVESGDVLTILVKEGQTIRANQPVVELETDKATVEVPCPHAGRVTKLHVREGQSVAVGSALVTVEPEETGVRWGQPPEPRSTGEAPPPFTARAAEAAPESARDRAAPRARAEEVAATTLSPQPLRSSAAPTPASANLPAGPAVRRLARELGVDLSGVRGTGPGGRIVREDVIAAVRKAATESARTTAPAAASQPAAAPPAPPGTPGEDPWGPVRRQKITRIRRTIAETMYRSWSTIPRVTNFDDADVTELERQRQASKEDYARDGIKLTLLPLVMKAAALCLRRHPVMNASLDLEQGEIIYKDYVNIGVAVDTDRGLVVPVIRGVDALRIPDIARALAAVAEAARANSFHVDDLRGGTFSISNLGAVGGTYSTPIIQVPEVAVLLLGRTREVPVVVGERIEPRLMMPLSLSYDHRLVDGAAAARFLNDLIAFLEAPARLLLAP